MPISILFVDDEPDLEQLIRLKYRRQLRSKEIETSFAGNGREALTKIAERDEPFDLIVTDINMPEMSGLELAQELQDRAQNTPVLIVSAYGDMNNVRAAMNAGAFDFLTKPLDFTDLEVVKDKALRRRAQMLEHSEAVGAAKVSSSSNESNDMSTLGLLVEGIVHELKNPLSFIAAFATLSSELMGELLENIDGATGAETRAQILEVKQVLSKILKHSDWALGIVGSMLESAATEPREIDVNTVISDHIDLFDASMRAQDPALKVSVDKELDPEIGQLSLAPQKLVRVVIILLENAYHALRTRGRSEQGFLPRVGIQTRGSGKWVELSVTDNGLGIPPEIRDQIFERGFTTKPPGEGSGMGLHLLRQLVHEVAGSVSIEDAEPQGVCVRVRLPMLATG